MKRILLLSVVLYLFSGLNAQAPQSFKYQAVARDASGNVITNSSVNLQISIIQGSPEDFSVYTETFSETTNAFGLINVEVGSGTIVSGTFETIDWGADSYFLKTWINGDEMGTIQLLSVPYALYAESSGNSYSDADIDGDETAFSGWDKDLADDFDGEYSSLTGIPADIADGDDDTQLTEADVDTYAGNNGYLTAETDPIYESSVASGITAMDSANWNEAYRMSMGNQKVLVPVLESDAIIELAPEKGEFLYNKSDQFFMVYDGISWRAIMTQCWPPPDQADAGPDQTITSGNTAVLSANSPAPGRGIGSWSFSAGEGGAISDIYDPNATLVGIEGETYDLTWTITNTCGIESKSGVRISFGTIVTEPNTIDWMEQVTANSGVWISGTALTSDGGILLTGHTSSTEGAFSANHGSEDVFAMRMDASGNLQWLKMFGGSGDDQSFWGFSEVSDGYLISGYSTSTDGDFANYGGYVLKIDEDGNIQRKYKIPDALGVDGACEVNGKYYLTGMSSDYNLFICELDTSSNETSVGSATFGGSGSDWGSSIHPTDDGGFYVLGIVMNPDGDVLNPLGGREYWLLKFNSSLSIDWQKVLGSPLDESWSVKSVLAPDGGIICAGASAEEDGSGNLAPYIVKVDQSGGIEWEYRLHAEGNMGEFLDLKIVGNTLYAIGNIESNGVVYAFNIDGDLKWRKRASELPGISGVSNFRTIAIGTKIFLTSNYDGNLNVIKLQ